MPWTYLPGMEIVQRQIVAFGGGGFSMEWGNTLLDDYVLSLTKARRPRVCFLPTASGDADHYIVRFYRAFASDSCEPSHISLFRKETGVGDARKHLLAQDVIYVGGGSVVSLLGTWRAHGFDEILREAWESGVVLCGGSAGALCWFATGLSGFHEGPAREVPGLGLLPWSCAVHYYHREQGRRGNYHESVARGLQPGFGIGDSAALRFVGTQVAEAVSSKPGCKAVFVDRDLHGAAFETELTVRYLGAEEDEELSVMAA
jgi:peptidase E